MTKYIFLPLPGYGHVNPSLAIAQELAHRGQEVVYYLPEEFRESVQATGATLRSYKSKLMKGIANLTPMRNEESRVVLPQVLERIRADRPDVIVYEPMGVWPRIVVQVLQVPAISLRPTYAMNERFNLSALGAHTSGERLSQVRDMLMKAHADMAELCASYHLPPMSLPDLFMYAEPLDIVFLPRAFQPEGDSFDERHLFVGPSILPRHDATDFPLDRLNPDRPLLYISLGTIFNNEPAFFKQCFEAFADSQHQVVLSRGKRIDPAALDPVPDNFLISPYVPQLDILSRARIFITHAGMNSTMESLYYGVPLIAVPQMPEQAMTGQRITELGLGLTLKKETVNAAVLRETVEQVANDEAIRARVHYMQQLTREAGGYRRAADAIMQYI